MALILECAAFLEQGNICDKQKAAKQWLFFFNSIWGQIFQSVIQSAGCVICVTSMLQISPVPEVVRNISSNHMGR